MRNKKMLNYGAAFLLLLLLGTVFFIVQFRRTEKNIRLSLQERIVTAERQIDKNIGAMIAGIHLQLVHIPAGQKEETISEQLQYVSKPERRYHLVTKDGALYQNGAQLPGDIAGGIAQRGYAFSFLPAAGEEKGSVAVVVPFLQCENCYVAALMPVDDFFIELTDEITANVEYIALVNAQNNTISGMYTNGAKQEDAIESAVRSFAKDYVNSGYTEQVYQAATLYYNAYIALPQLPGWTLGAWLYCKEFEPIWKTLIINSIFFFACCLLTFIFQLVLRAVAARNARIRQATQHVDPLTGLLAPAALFAAAREFFTKHTRSEYSLVSVDLVAFHRFNTMYGYEAGDQLLKALGLCIAKNYDCGTHINSDVFMFLTKNEYPMAGRLTHTLNSGIANEMDFKYLPAVQYKFGICPLLQEETSLRNAYDHCLIALRTAKTMPKQMEVVYDIDMHRKTALTRNVELYMQRALEQEEFLVYVQPQFRLAGLTCCGGEALIRWESAHMGFLSPFQFIPLFESNGFIAEVDFYMMRHVLDYLQQVYDAGGMMCALAVNQSRITISFPNYLERLRDLVQKYSFPLQFVEIEITESALTDAGEAMVNLLFALRQMGFTISMDDFGTGYSSLNALRELPVDILKIDKEFINESDTSERGRIIIRNVISMAKELNITTISEGVERGSQLDFLLESGCDIGQGYLFEKPMLLKEFHERHIRNSS
ncbi:bifunctional diguanylate cyclase/phosphodiesterase [Christensenellaceae bacterium OttesenSCG-928-L17]|nr:bifunctional diguanylate cyclase/phosphodiesterase [Christensenellaceae bacterium OttesenSCG-928-L17]